ncbi:hypothetical protein INR49_028130, partial [Caranx melampygus]
MAHFSQPEEWKSDTSPAQPASCLVWPHNTQGLTPKHISAGNPALLHYPASFLRSGKKKPRVSQPAERKMPLQQPTLSLTSPDGGLVWSPEAAQVTRGYSFIITCFISSHYPGGVFSLIFAGSNTTVTEPAVNHSASFGFPAEYEHQGNYS